MPSVTTRKEMEVGVYYNYLSEAYYFEVLLNRDLSLIDLGVLIHHPSQQFPWDIDLRMPWSLALPRYPTIVVRAILLGTASVHPPPFE